MQRGENTPYRQLGKRLSEIRKSLQETIPEVSGAVEIEAETLVNYEKGEARPSEDVLGLLISHYDLSDRAEDELWDLAGYANSHTPEDLPPLPNVMLVPTDNRILYTDSAQVTVNNFGVMMQFMQNGINNHPMPVARVGMSLEHAKTVLEILAATIAQTERAKTPKSLPQPQQPHGKSKRAPKRK